MELPTGPVYCGTRGLPRRYGDTCECHGRRYTCPRCKRFVPYCFGGAGDSDAIEGTGFDDRVCTDCWSQLVEMKRGAA